MRASWLVAAVAGCNGTTGTVQLELTTAPSSTLLDGVQRLRVTITDPLDVVEAHRTDSGFDLVLEVEATGVAGSLIVEGFDAGDSLIATGSSPPFAVSAINAHVVVYMATPLSIAPSPSPLPAARIGVASTPLTFGFGIAGGEDATGVRTDSLFIYNVFDHSLAAGLPMPAAKSFQIITTASNNGIYLFGGLGTDGAPTGSAWRFDTNSKPNGAYAVQADHVELARSGTVAVPIDPEKALITGTPPFDLLFGTPAARTDLATLEPSGAAATFNNKTIALFAGNPIVRFQNNVFDTVAIAADPLSTAVALPDGRIVFAGGASAAILQVIDPATGAASSPGVLSTVRSQPAVAVTDRFLVVAGGLDATAVPIATADVFDATSLRLVATIPCFARSGAHAMPLPNGQVAIVGGEPANDLIELFTPPPP